MASALHFAARNRITVSPIVNSYQKDFQMIPHPLKV
jgi:hypothetical protein